MLLAVPSTMRITLQRLQRLGLYIFSFSDFLHLSFSCSCNLLECLVRQNLFWTQAAFFKRTAAGGVLLWTKSNERSSYTVMTTESINQLGPAVRALKSFVKPMMLIPAWPKAGPALMIAGVALPAGIWSFTMFCYFLATKHTSLKSVIMVKRWPYCWSPTSVWNILS